MARRGWHLYLDESGDLGFDFQAKAPSRFLTIAVLATSQDQTVKRIRTAVKRTLKNKVDRGKKNEQELKGSSTDIAVKRYFYGIIKDCKFGVYAVTLNKFRVLDQRLRGEDATDRLYNWVARISETSIFATVYRHLCSILPRPDRRNPLMRIALRNIAAETSLPLPPPFFP